MSTNLEEGDAEETLVSFFDDRGHWSHATMAQTVGFGKLHRIFDVRFLRLSSPLPVRAAIGSFRMASRSAKPDGEAQ